VPQARLCGWISSSLRLFSLPFTMSHNL
jgi:hypothetical protein